MTSNYRFGLLTFALVFGCQQRSAAIEAAPAPLSATLGAAARAPLAPVLSYPPGPWRKAAPEDLERLVLWPSHLLIRYDGVKVADNVPFSMADFHSVPAPPVRSREEALALARQLAARARAEPERFAELVREHSEDLVRRERGGSLGGIPAMQLSPWPEVLDALTAIEPGQTSDVVETWYGFHVFLRRPAPEPDMVTGQRIVIAHDQARFLSAVLGEDQPVRSRGEALELAQSVLERARSSPGEFSKLAERYSEHPSRLVGGDFGTWSNRELTPFPAEVEILDQLEPGQISAPFDSLFGIQIIRRIPGPERVSYAFEGVQLHFDRSAAPGDALSLANVEAEARRLSESLRRDPGQLGELAKRYTSYRDQWLDGRGLPELTVAVQRVAPGEVLPGPTRAVSFFLVGRRVAPSPQAPVAALLALPRDVGADVVGMPSQRRSLGTE